MSHNLLKGKRGIIFGALNEHSIAWKVAVKAVEEGASITLTNTLSSLLMPLVSKIWKKYSQKANVYLEVKSILSFILSE